MNGTYAGNNDGIAADVERWLRTCADAARHSLEGAGRDRHAETHAARNITNALAYAQAAGDIVSIVGEPGRGKTWASQRYCAGKSNAFFLGVSSAVHSLSGLLSLVGGAPDPERRRPRPRRSSRAAPAARPRLMPRRGPQALASWAIPVDRLSMSLYISPNLTWAGNFRRLQGDRGRWALYGRGCRMGPDRTPSLCRFPPDHGAVDGVGGRCNMRA